MTEDQDPPRIWLEPGFGSIPQEELGRLSGNLLGAPGEKERSSQPRFIWRPVTEDDLDLHDAVQSVNRAAEHSMKASCQAERLEAISMYLAAVECLIKPSQGVTRESIRFMMQLHGAIIALRRGYVPPQLEPIPLKREPSIKADEWYRRAAFAVCYYVLKKSGYLKKEALSKIEQLAIECNVTLPLNVDLEQAIINNFSYKTGESKDKRDAVEFYEQAKKDFDSWPNLQSTKDQAFLHCKYFLLHSIPI